MNRRNFFGLMGKAAVAVAVTGAIAAIPVTSAKARAIIDDDLAAIIRDMRNEPAALRADMGE
jgi:hypothetical protein